MMHQEADDPADLLEVAGSLKYKPGWTVWVEDLDRGQGCSGLTLCVLLDCQDAYHPELHRRVVHYFPVPAAAYDRRSWRRWLFDQLGLVDVHERMEWFEVDGERPYAPNHGPGRDPYVVHEVGADMDRRTSFRGVVKEGR